MFFNEIGKELKDFIVHARMNTYASGKQPRRNQGKIYSFKQGGFEYQDTYYDRERIFQGQEVIFYSGQAVWSFSYRGVVNSADTHEVFSFLQMSLLKQGCNTRFHIASEEVSENWRYSCQGWGSFEECSGEEIIYFKNVPVYRMKYLAGAI
jgi:hypothetical protein